MSDGAIDVRWAERDELSVVADVFGRAFVNEPMMRWPLGEQADLVGQCTRCFAYFLERALELGIVQATTDLSGAAAWVPPAAAEAWAEHPWNQSRIRALGADGGVRYDAFWDWVYAQDPDEDLWQLDSVAVAPEFQGRGIGRTLIEVGLNRARAGGVGAFLTTGTPANVGFYESCGFRVTKHLDAPRHGPHIWFMRWDP